MSLSITDLSNNISREFCYRISDIIVTNRLVTCKIAVQKMHFMHHATVNVAKGLKQTSAMFYTTFDYIPLNGTTLHNMALRYSTVLVVTNVLVVSTLFKK